MKKMILGVIAIVLCGVLLNAQDKHEYNKAVERCNGADNIVSTIANTFNSHYYKSDY